MDLVTGAAGHLGNTLVRRLLRSGRKVRVFLREKSDNSCLEGLDVHRSFGDICDIDSIIPACKGVENVYHTAAEISIMPYGSSIMRRVNHRGTENIIAACLKNNVSKLIYTSSIHALADSPQGTIIDEQAGFDPQNPRGAYDRTKASASLLSLRAAKNGLHTVILCPTAIIGPYDFKISLLGRFFIDYLNGKMKFIINGAYNYVDVRDVADAHIKACLKAPSGQTYILGGKQVDMRKLVNLLNLMTGIKPPRYWLSENLAGLATCFTTAYYLVSRSQPQFTRYALSTIKSNSCISYQKAVRELEYSPRPFEQSLKDTLEWYKERFILCPPPP